MRKNFEYLKYLSQAVAVVTVNGDIKYLNLKAQDLFGSSLDLLEGLENIKLNKYKDTVKDILATVYESKQKKSLSMKNENNEEFVFQFFINEGEIIIEVLSKSNEMILKDDIFNFIVSNSSDMISFKGEDLVYRFVNDTGLQLLHLQDKDIIGFTDEDLVEKEILAPILHHQILQGDIETIEKGTYSSIEFFSNESYYQVSKKYLYNGILCVSRNITTEINASNQIEIDEMTSLYNRKAMCRMLKSISKDKEYHVVEIVIENFGEVVNKHDLQYANRCLKQLAYFLKKYPDALFFYLDGIGFVGLFDKKLANPDKVRELLLTQISNINLPSLLKIEVTMKIINDDCHLIYFCN